MALEFFKKPDGTIFAIGPYGKRPISAPEWKVYRQAGYTAKLVDNLGKIPNFSAGGLTKDQTRVIVRKELDRETKAV